MASTYTTSFGIEKIGDGEQSETWGDTTNFNFDIIDRIAGYTSVALSGTTHTLTVREASPGSGTENLQDGMYRVIKFTGALGGNNTVTIAPNTAKVYFIFENATTDSGSSGPYSVIISQGSGSNVTIQNGKNVAVYCDGAGSGAAVINALSDLQVDTLAGTLSTAAQANITSLGTLTALTVDDVAVNGKVITMTGSSSDTAVFTAAANGALSIVTTDAAAAAANIQITADGTVDIDSAGVLTLDSGAAINLEPASGSAILLDGTISVDAGVVTGATSITSTAFVGDITGNVTGNTSGTAATVTTAAQPNITSLGTLTTLTVDNIIINGTNIGHTSDTDSLAIASDGVVTFSQVPVFPDDTVETADIQDNAVTLAKMASGTDGNIISYDASGNPVAIATGSDGQVLTSAGAGAPPAFEDAAGGMTSFQLEDDDGTEVTISNAKEVKFIGDGLTTNWTDTSHGTDGDPYDMTFSVDAAQTGITSLLATDIKIGEDDQTKIDFETADEIHFYAGNEHQIKLVDGALVPASDNNIDLGTSSVEFKDAFFDGTVTSDAFAGPLTGDVTGNTSGTAATVTTAAQPNITSLGTLTALTVDDVAIDGKVITMTGSSSDTAVLTAGTNGTLSIVTTDAAAAAAHIQITADGTAELAGTTVTLDSGGDIILDVGDDELKLRKSGTGFGNLYNSSDNFVIRSETSDKDIIFKGNDGGSASTTVLTLDMSEAGKAIFNAGIVIADAGNIGSVSDEDAIAIAADGVVTFSQAISGTSADFDGGVTIDNFTIDGSEIDLSSGNLTIDVQGDINLDAGGGDIYLKDDGTDWGLLYNRGSNHFYIRSLIEDGDIQFRGFFTGNDNQVALTLDMSDSGTAVFNHDIRIADAGQIGSASDADAIAIGADGDVTLTQDLELQHDGATISFGTNDDVTLTHVHDTGLLLNSTMQLQFSDASQYINAPSATVLDVNATDEIELNATLVDVNATLDVSGAAQFSSTVTVGVDDTGYDVKLFGATAGHYLQWDASADKLALYGELQTVTAGTGNLALGNGTGIAIASGGNYNTLIGNNVGAAITTGDYNTGMGAYALQSEDEHGYNTAVGYSALRNLNAGAAGYNTAIGHNSCTALTTGRFNTAVGHSALKTEDAHGYNTAIGYHALENQNAGANAVNTAVGMYAGRLLTTGIRNTLLGYAAGHDITTSGYNVAIGYATLYEEDTDGGNVAIGHEALRNQNVGADALAYNTAVGYSAGLSTTTGTKNTFIGGIAGQDNTEGASNTFVGYGAGRDVIDGNYNTAVGETSFYDSTGATGCVALGYQSLANVTTASSNTGLGRQAGQLITTGDLNTAVGAYALDAETVGDRSTAVGYAALGGQANTSNADILNSALGYNAGKTITTGRHNTYMGAYAGGVVTTGSDNTYLGYNTDASAVDVSDEIVIGRDVVGGGTATARFGVGSNTATLGIDGSDTSWAAASDERLKTEIKDSNAGLDFVNDLRPVTYQWKAQKDVPSEMSQHDPASDEPCKGAGKTHHGFVAQDVKRVIDSHELANGHNIWSEDPDGTQQIAPGNFMPMAIKAIQELSAKVEILEARLQQYENK